MDEKLTAKEQRFVEEYCVDFNTTQAAIRAGYSGKSRTNGHNVINRPRVAAAIAERRKALAEETDVTIEQVRRELAEIGFDKNEDSKVRVSALTQLGRHLGMFVDKTEHSGRLEGPPILEVIVKRSDAA